MQGLRNAHASLHEAELVLIEVNSDVEVLTEQNSAVKTLLKTKEGELDGLNKSLKDIAGKATQLLNSCIALNSDPVMHEFVRQLPEGQTIEELETEIESDKARLDLMHEGNGGIIRDFEQRQKKIDTLKAKLEEVKHALDELDGKLKDIKDRWEPELDRLVKNISASFAFNMRQINCAGEVGIYKDEQEFDQWAIQIQVKFRYVNTHGHKSSCLLFCRAQFSKFMFTNADQPQPSSENPSPLPSSIPIVNLAANVPFPRSSTLCPFSP